MVRNKKTLAKGQSLFIVYLFTYLLIYYGVGVDSFSAAFSVAFCSAIAVN